MDGDRLINRLNRRLAAVDPRLISTQTIQQARTEGCQAVRLKPDAFVYVALERSRHNPITATAFSLGLTEESGLAHSETRIATEAALGIALTAWGYQHESLPYLEKAARKLTGKAALYARWHWLINARRFQHVADVFESLMDIAGQLEAVGDPDRAMRCRQDAALQLLPTPRREEAIVLLRQTESHFAGTEQPGDRGISLIRLAYAQFQQGELDAGLSNTNLAASLFEAEAMPAWLAIAWIYRGIYFKHRREVAEASRWLRKGIEQARALRHDYYATIGLTELAHLQYEQGDIPASLRIYAQLRRLAARLRLKFLFAQSELTLANLYVRQGEIEIAAEGYGRARQAFDELDYSVFAGLCTLNLGVVACHRGHFSESIQLEREAAGVFEKAGTYEHLARAYHNLGKTYAAFSYFEPAARHYERGIRILENAGVEGQAVLPMIHLAHLLAGMGRVAEARSMLEQAIALAEESGLDRIMALSRRVLGDVALLEKNPSVALDLYRHSREMMEKLEEYEGVWEAHLGMAEAHFMLAENEVAASLLSQLDPAQLPVTSRWRYHVLSGSLHNKHGRADEGLREHIRVLTQIGEARGTLEQEDEASHLALAFKSVYETAFQSALTLQDVESALLIAEVYGGQLLSARLGQAVAQADLYQLPQDVSRSLSSRFGEEWTALRYAWHGDNLWIFVLTPDGVQLIPIRLNAAVRAALRHCASPDISFRQFAYSADSPAPEQSKAYRQLLCEALFPDGVCKRLSPDHTLIIVPTGQLYGLAFHALLDAERPLIERTRLVYGHSLRLLERLDVDGSAHDETGRGLVLAQSTFSNPDYPDLPHVSQEAAAIARIDSVDRLEPPALNRDSLNRRGEAGQLAQYDWLHIATHGYIEPETGYVAGLLFNPDVIYLEDFRRWKLHARLVTLSACQTGLGRWFYGDEIAGLTQAFLTAGAKAVLSSLWLIADARTLELMTHFYTTLRDDPSEALAATQRMAHRDGIDPLHWAAFSLFA